MNFTVSVLALASSVAKVAVAGAQVAPGVDDADDGFARVIFRAVAYLF